jgi:hypothetical protein
MSMRDEHPPDVAKRKVRVELRAIHRPWVEYRKFARAEDVTVGARPRHHPWVAGQHAAHTGRNSLGHTGAKFMMIRHRLVM